MKFEEVLKKAKGLKAPEIIVDQIAENQTYNNMENFIHQLKKVDLNTRRSIRILQLLYAIMSLVASYVLLFETSGRISIGLGLIILAFLLVIFVQQLRYKAYTNTYTNNPVILFLKAAKKRMQVFTRRTWYVIPIWISIDIGLCFILSSLLQGTPYTLIAIMLLQIVLIFLIIIDFYTAYLIWKKEHKPIVIEIEKMLDEIENP